MIAATNRNLREMIAQGTFREDLFYRLNVIHLIVPPLRERREDIPVLVDHFLQPLHARERLTDHRRSSPEAMKALTRVLAGPATSASCENVIERLVVTAPRRRSQLEDLPPEVRAPGRRRAPAEARAPPDRRRRSLQAAHRASASRSGPPSIPLYMEREITRAQRARRRPQGPRGGARQLQDRRAAVQHGAARLQDGS